MKDNKSNNRRNFIKTCALGTFFTSCIPNLKYQSQNNINSQLLLTSTKLRCPFCNTGCMLVVQTKHKPIINNENYNEEFPIKNILPADVSNGHTGRICIRGMNASKALLTQRQSQAKIRTDVYDRYLEWKKSKDDIQNEYDKLNSDKKLLRDKTLGYNSDKTKKGDFLEIPIEEAMKVIAYKILHTKQKHSGNEIYSYSSSSLSIETHYAVNKFIRGHLSSPNLDSDVRLSDMNPASALKNTLGTYLNNTVPEDIFNADMVCMSGINIRSSFPVVFWEYENHIRNNSITTLIADPRKTATVNELQKTIQKKSDAEIKSYGYSTVTGNPDGVGVGNLYHTSISDSDALFINLITYFILTEFTDAIDKAFIDSYTANYTALEQFIIENYNPEYIKVKFDVNMDMVRKIAEELSKASIKAKSQDKGGVVWLIGSGIANNLYGYETTISIINLLAITGNLLRNGSGILPMFNSNNYAGNIAGGNIGEVLLSGIGVEESLKDRLFQNWNNTGKSYIEHISSKWGVDEDRLKKLLTNNPKPFAKTFTRGLNKDASTVFIFGRTPLKLIPSYNKHFKSNLSRSFVVLLDIYEDSHNTEFSDIILQSPTFTEQKSSNVNLSRKFYINPQLVTNSKIFTVIEYIDRLINAIGNISPQSNALSLFPESKKELSNNDRLYNELAELSRTTEFELPSIKDINSEMLSIPFSKQEHSKFLSSGSNKNLFFKKFRTANGKVSLIPVRQNYIENLLEMIPKNDTNDSSNNGNDENPGEIVKLNNIINENINFETLKDNQLAKIKSYGIIIRGRDTDYYEKSLAEIKADDKYPFLLSTGTVYEHYSFGLTGHSKLISETIPEPYVEINQKLADRFSLKVGEDIRIKTPVGQFTAVISIYNNYKVKPSRNDVPEYFIFIPYNIEYYKYITKNEKLGVLSLFMSLFDPVTNVPDLKMPCRIEFFN